MVSGCCCLSYADVRALRTPTVLCNWKDTTHWLQNTAKTKREAAFIEEIIFVEDCKELVYLVFRARGRRESAITSAAVSL
mmetsp:Transcript_25311/g.38876  ORF Transcript_25311/g.38876 Transcript_25311/m.38876 type:complete len:80 (+) Transcript_25311:532-771(+)